MTKKLTAAFLALLMCFLLVSCTTSVNEDPEDFDFKKLSGIPLADIKIAYIHAEETSLMRDIHELAKEKRIVGMGFTELDISGRESFDGLFTELFAKGYNVFFLDGALPEEFINTLPLKKQDVYFVSHGNGELKSERLVSFEDDFLEYSYLLGVIAAESRNAQSIGVLTDSFEYYSDINAFAAGVKLVNSNIKVIVSEKMQTLTQNGCEAVFIPNLSEGYTGNAKVSLYGFESAQTGNFLFADYSSFFNECITSVINGNFVGGSVKLGVRHGSMDASLKSLGLSDELNEKVNAIKEYFASGMPVFSENQLMLSGEKVISVKEVVIDNRGNTVIDENGNYYYYSDVDLITCESYEELVNEKMNYYYSNVELK